MANKFVWPWAEDATVNHQALFAAEFSAKDLACSVAKKNPPDAAQMMIENPMMRFHLAIFDTINLPYMNGIQD